MSKIKAQYEDQITKLKEQFEKEKAAILEDHRRALEALREQMEKEKQDALAKLTQTNEKMLKAMNEKFKKNMDKTKNDYEDKIKNLNEEHAEKVQQLENEKDALLQEIEQLKKQVNELESEKNKLQGLIDVEVEARIAAEEKVQGALDRMNQVVQEYDEKTVRLEKEYTEKEAKLKFDLKNRMDALIKEHVEDMESIQADFQRTQELMDDKYAQLEERYNEIQSLYDSRPSRPEDMEAIRALQRELGQKDEIIKKQIEDMKFYKLELVNREDSYNKMFGTNPMVGVMDPRTAIKK
jgi:chromosome segregation ATPase